MIEMNFRFILCDFTIKSSNVLDAVFISVLLCYCDKFTTVNCEMKVVYTLDFQKEIQFCSKRFTMHGAL